MRSMAATSTATANGSSYRNLWCGHRRRAHERCHHEEIAHVSSHDEAREFRPFTDSSEVIGDGEALRQRLDRDSYLFFRGLLEADDIATTRREVVAALDAAGWLAPDSDPMEAIPGPLIRREADDNWYDGYAAIQRQQGFHRLAHHPALRTLMASILDDEVLVHPRKIARVSFPGADFPTPPHQDYPHIQGTADVLTAWIPLGACPQALGGLRILEGSHDRLLDVRRRDGVGGFGVDVDENDPRWATTE